MISHRYIDEYVAMYENGDIKLNQDRIDLIHYVQNVVLVMDGIYFDNKQINDCVAFTEKWFFELEPFQKFLICFIFLYFEENDTVFDIFLWFMARGSGKNGLMSPVMSYLTSSLHGVDEYNVAMVANTEKQAMKSFMDVHKMLKKNPALTDRETGEFRNGLTQITNTETLSTIEYLTSNAETKDSFAHGAVVFDEVHQYENYDIINVLTDGLGKVQPPRTFIISTDGFVREGVYDKELEKARNVLKSETFESRIFPWICTLDNPKEVEDESNWQKSNPMLHPPMSKYAQGLYRTVKKQYGEVNRGERNKVEWLTKRMNISGLQHSQNVASQAEIKAANRSLPDDLSDYYAIGGLDYASLKDFASVGLLFKCEDEYVWLTHSFVLKNFIDREPLKITPMIPLWEEQGLLTVVDEPTIGIEHIVNWFVKMRELYDFNVVVGDTYRMDYVRNALEEEGFEVEFVRRAKSIEAMVAPQIEIAFAQQKLIWGDNPLMNWFAWNVKVVRDKFGNMMYEKRGEIKHKTDGFMAFTNAFWKGTELFPEAPEEFAFADFWD